MSNEKREAIISNSNREGWIRVVTPYDEKCVADLKSYIEPGDRSWNKDSVCWEIREHKLGTLITILKKHFGDNVSQNLTTEKKKNAEVNPWRELFIILKKMPNADLGKIYTTLAMAVHPDRGGSAEQMSLLNSAYDEVKK